MSYFNIRSNLSLMSYTSLLFATTNHIERLDPALSRPGRMDVWINFTHATKWQAEGLFKCFFPSKPPLPKNKRTHVVPLLPEDEIADLAKKFADQIPEDELSVASLQGYLLRNKTRPRECVEEVAAWVVQERETKERLKKEKEKAELEAKEKAEAEEKAKKEKEEKEAKEAKAKEEKEKEKEKARKLKKRADAIKAEVVTESSSSGSSASETDNSNGADADSEASMTSEEESAAAKEKWVAVKSQSTGTQTAPDPEEVAS